MSSVIYLDYHSTTPVDPRVLEVMIPYFTKHFGNPSGANQASWIAKEAVDRSREYLARILECSSDEVVFTASATEANNLVISSVMRAYADKEKNRVLVSSIEHKSVLKTAQTWASNCGILPVDATGQVCLETLEKELQKNDVILVSVHHANNEIGSIQNLLEISRLCQKYGCFFHTDAVQTFAKYPLSTKEIPVDFVTWSAHKFYGPKGVGGLFCRKGIQLAPQIVGGDHEKKLRAGTLNVPGIVAMGEAADLSYQLQASEHPQIARMRDDFQSALLDVLRQNDIHFEINNSTPQRLYNNISLSLLNFELKSVQTQLRPIAFSTGSACTSGSGEPSHVLTAIGRDKFSAQNTLRLSLGRMTQKSELDQALEIFKKAFNR